MRVARTAITTLAPPCRAACAAGESPREWITQIRSGSQTALHDAWRSIVDVNPLPAVLARICYAGCESSCCRDSLDAPLSIRALERFVADSALREQWPLPQAAPPTGTRLTVVGSGPCGLSAAYQLARAGHDVTLLDAHHQAGGMLRRGITDQRLPKQILDAEIERICAVGVRLETGRTSRRVSDELATADGVIWAVGASMCMAIVEGRTIWSQPVHTDERVTRTATVSVGRGRRAALALNAHLAGTELASEDEGNAVDPGDVILGLYGRRPPRLPAARLAQTHPGHSALIAPYPIADVAAEADRCLSCGRCFGCAACVAACPFGAVEELGDGRFAIVPELCSDCGECIHECPCGAIREPG